MPALSTTRPLSLVCLLTNELLNKCDVRRANKRTIVSAISVRPARKFLVQHLDKPIRNQANNQNHHRDGEHLCRIKLRAVPLRQSAEANKSDEHLPVDHPLDRPSHTEPNAGENKRQGGRKEDPRENLIFATAEGPRHLHQ